MNNDTLREALALKEDIQRHTSKLRDIRNILESAERQPETYNPAESLNLDYTVSIAQVGKHNFVELLKQMERLHRAKLAAAEEAFRDL